MFLSQATLQTSETQREMASVSPSESGLDAVRPGTDEGFAIKEALLRAHSLEGGTEEEQRVKRLIMLQIAQQLSHTLECALRDLTEQVLHTFNTSCT